MYLLTIVAATLAAALFQGVESSPIIVAVLGLLGIPGITSLVTSLIDKASTALGIKTEAIVYLVSLGLTGAILLTTGLNLPAWADDPTVYVAAWAGWATANTLLAKTIFQVLNPKINPKLVTP